MRTMGESYLGSSQQLVSSFEETINATKEMHDEFTTTVHKLTIKADRNNKDEAVKLETSSTERFNQIKDKVNRYYRKAKSVYGKCKRATSWLTFGLARGCAGKKLPNAPEIKRFQLQTNNLKNSMKPLLQYIGDGKWKDDKEYTGTRK